MRGWLEARLGTEDEFWRSTPRQIGRQFDALGARQTLRHDERAALAWHIAALMRSQKLPPLKTLLHGASTKSRRIHQTPEERWASFQTPK